MNRNNEIARKANILQHWRLVRGWACKVNDLKQADLELLIYLEPIDYFTHQDFRDGTLLVNWDKLRLQRLQRQEWIKKVANHTWGGHSKFTVSSKGKRLINRLYRILLGEEEIPESVSANSIMKKGSYVDKLYSKAITKFNKRSL